MKMKSEAVNDQEVMNEKQLDTKIAEGNVIHLLRKKIRVHLRNMKGTMKKF